ncbi:MAG: HIT family protein [Candidatus Woesearchaeota archaeon]|nr:MAG: HIT family protein [Candidatus Woesearchaeota archaeon]
MDTAIYEDDMVLCRGAAKPVSPGHIEVVPKVNATTFAELTPDQSYYLYQIASVMASQLFETKKFSGTNIIATENNQQLVVHVIGRSEGDGLDFTWQPVMGPEQLGDVANQIGSSLQEIGDAKEQKKPAPAEKKKPLNIKPVEEKATTKETEKTDKSSEEPSKEEQEESSEEEPDDSLAGSAKSLRVTVKKLNYLLKQLERHP